MRTRSKSSGGPGESAEPENENGTTRSETAASTPASQKDKDGRRRKKSMDSQEAEESKTMTMKAKIKKIKKEEEGPLYKETDKLLCYFNGRLYDAQILEVKSLEEFVANDVSDISEGDVDADAVPTFRTRSTDDDRREDEQVDPDQFVYYIHYAHWGVKWDEWVRSDCLKLITDDARREQEELKKEMAKKSKLRKTPKRKRKSQSNFNVRIPESESQGKPAPKLEDINTPTVSEVTCRLEEHLASLEFIGKLKAAAFCKKLLQSYEQHFHYVMSPIEKEQVVKTMTAKGLQQHADVIHFTGLLKLIDWLGAGASSGWEAESYEEFKKDDLSDLREIFLICAEYFDATKRFLLEKTKQLPAHLYSTPLAFGSDDSNAA